MLINIYICKKLKSFLTTKFLRKKQSFMEKINTI